MTAFIRLSQRTKVWPTKLPRLLRRSRTNAKVNLLKTYVSDSHLYNKHDIFQLGDLAEATPALEAAINALDTLKPADITLVKSMRHPPTIVKLVMEAVCVMKQIAPVKKLDMATGKMVDNYWQAAQKILGDLRFLDLLRSYDKDNIPVHVMKRIREKCVPSFLPFSFGLSNA